MAFNETSKVGCLRKADTQARSSVQGSEVRQESPRKAHGWRVKLHEWIRSPRKRIKAVGLMRPFSSLMSGWKQGRLRDGKAEHQNLQS